MNHRRERVTRPRPRGRALAFAAVYGAVVATIAYVVAGGNPFWMLVAVRRQGAQLSTVSRKSASACSSKRTSNPPSAWWMSNDGQK